MRNLIGKKPYEINRMGVARTFQNIRLFPQQSVLDNVMTGLNNQVQYSLAESLLHVGSYHKKEKEMTERSMEILRVFGLEDSAQTLASNLPYGKQRKLEIARALATKPELLLLDEPAAGMNPNETGELMDTIRLVRKEYQVTILLIEHDMKLVQGICEYLYVLNFGRLLAEGTNLEADMVTMSTFYLQSAQDQNNMFLPLTFDVNTLEEVPDYTAPITSQEGAIIVNTEMLAENNLPMPTCLKDLADPAYAGFVAVTDVQSSSTAWLLMQALVSEYGEEEAQNILHDIYVNAGDHVESSGSAPLQLCEAGEVAVGFGLRHQAVAAKNDGLPIDYVDPTEGNFSLTESVAVLDKGDATNPLAMKMAQCIIENGRAELQQNYPNPLYEGESSDNANKSAYPKTFSEPLTFELYEHHIEISEAAKP